MTSPMRVLVFASQKGGSGKTTLAGHIAVEAERSGDGPVALIDTDPQGSLSKWWNSRQSQTPVFIQSVFSQLYTDLQQIRQAGYQLVVVDTPPAVTRAIAEVVAVADMLVLPTRPSPHDLRAVGPTVDIAESHQKPVIFAINAATKRARITSEAAVALSQHGTVAPVNIHNRIDFAASMIDGRTVMETDPDGQSAEEIGELWQYLRDRLARLDRTSDQPSDDRGSPLPNFNGLGKPGGTFGRRAVQ